MQLQLQREFKEGQKRHYLNGILTVIHCHHYSSLMTQLADDARGWNAPELLKDAFAEATYETLDKYFKEHNIQDIQSKVAVAEEYFRIFGLGKLQLNIEKKFAELVFSHIDEGWQSKWGSSEYPVNFVGQGFIAAAFALITGSALSSVKVQEIQSIVCGAATSQFNISQA